MPLLNSNHYETLLDYWPLIKFMFKNVSNDYQEYCELEHFEFRNENDQIEIQTVFYFLKTSPYSYNEITPFWSGWVIHTFVEFVRFLM